MYRIASATIHRVYIVKMMACAHITCFQFRAVCLLCLLCIQSNGNEHKSTALLAAAQKHWTFAFAPNTRSIQTEMCRKIVCSGWTCACGIVCLYGCVQLFMWYTILNAPYVNIVISTGDSNTDQTASFINIRLLNNWHFARLFFAFITTIKSSFASSRSQWSRLKIKC